MKLTTRELTTIAVFGTLWGIVEISLGSVLKSLNIPFSGAVLSAIGVTIAMICRCFVPKKGTTFFVGIIAMLLKLFSIGGVIIGPMVGILSEAIVCELVLSLMGSPRRFSFVVAGVFCITGVLLQPFVTGPILFGRTLFVVWLDMIDLGTRYLGINSNAVLVIVIVLLLIHVGIGISAGVFSWDVAHRLKERMSKSKSNHQLSY